MNAQIELPLWRTAPKVTGFFKLRAHKLDGSSRDLTGWFPNLVVDTGLNRIGTGSYLSACHVGTSTTAPANSDTQVGGFLAGTSSVVADTYGAQGTAPYYGWRLKTYRFALGAVVGNVGSVAIATAATDGGTTILFSRARVLDDLGAPTTVTVLADEILDVTYELRLYPPLSDTTHVGASITGSGTHDITVRAANVTAGINWGGWLGAGITFSPRSSSATVYNGAIGAITGAPAGVSAQIGNGSMSAYSNNSLERAATFSMGLTAGNLAGGIRALYFETSLGAFQAEFSPAIAKDATKTLALVFKVAWARNV